MIFQDFAPSPQLAHLVRFYRVRHFNFPHKAAVTAKPYPARPEHCITFCVRGRITVIHPITGEAIITPRSYLSGQYTQRINKLCMEKELLMVLVVFHPGAVHQLTGIPCNELQDTGINLADVFYSDTKSLETKLDNAGSYDELLRLVDAFLKELYAKKELLAERPLHKVFRMMMAGSDMTRVEKLASEACLSIRQLERQFMQWCGVSPSRMMQIVRFDQAYRLKLQHPEYNWLRIAMHCGFHDYQHLAKAFQTFALASPGTLFSDEAKSPERKLGLIHTLNG